MILQGVLASLKAGERKSILVLANELEISPQMLSIAMMQLETMGYVRRVMSSQGCQLGSCKNCAGCALMSQERLLPVTWELIAEDNGI